MLALGPRSEHGDFQVDKRFVFARPAITRQNHLNRTPRAPRLLVSHTGRKPGQFR